MNWPIVDGDYKTYNENKPLAVIFLGNQDWRRGYFEKNVAISGKLITPQGIQRIVLNVISNPNIRSIAIIGDEIYPFQPLDAFISLYLYGINDEKIIRNSSADVKKLNIDKKYVETFREQIIDLNFFDDEQQLKSFVNGNSLDFKKFDTGVDIDSNYVVDAEQNDVAHCKINHKIVASSIYDAWIKSMRAVWNNGKIVKTSGFEFKELLNLFVEIRNVEAINYNKLNVERERLDDYVDSLIRPEPETNSEYTYGRRMRYFGERNIDQINRVIDRLKSSPNSRRATICLWDPGIDSEKDNGQPCLTSVDFKLRDDKLNLTAIFRSNDIYGAAPINWYGLSELLKYTADELGVNLGKLTILAQSAHIYSTNFAEAKDKLDINHKHIDSYMEDEFGYFFVEIESKNIFVSFFDIDGNLMKRFEGKNAKKLRKKILNENIVSLKEHASYLGEELQKAELSIKHDIGFEQSEA